MSTARLLRLDHVIPWATLLLVVACGTSSDSVGPPSVLQVLTGNGQSGVVGAPLAVAPTIQVRDAGSHGLVGVVVRFTVTSGGGSLAVDTAVTNGSGVATAPQWTLGTKSGPNTLKVQAAGLTSTISIAATGVAGAPASMVAVDQQFYAALALSPVASPPTVLVSDGYGNPVSGVIVTFTPTLNTSTLSGNTPVTDAQGLATLGSWILSATPGLNRIVASTNGVASLTFEAQGLSGAPSIVPLSPVGQSGFQGAMVPKVPQVRVTTAQGQILPNIPVLFTVRLGDGTVVGGATSSDPVTGIAAPIDWKLGVTATFNSVDATIPGFSTAKVTFGATGTFSPYLIDVRFVSSATPAQRDAFASAASRWMQIIVGDLPDVPVNLAVGAACNGIPSPAMNETIDDVVIFAQVTPIDGVGGVLGSAGPCIRRTTGLFTAIGSMRFDVADLVGLQNTNRLETVILHEMAHVLGFGTVWTDKGLLTGSGGAAPFFTGAEALTVWPSFNLGFAGQPVPVEGTPAPTGTRDSHWRESVLTSELMTGYIEAPGVPTPLSRLTIASFKDLGYSVSYSTADSYAGNLLAALRESGERLGMNDVVEHATQQITPWGQILPIR